MSLSDTQIARYARHLVLPEIDFSGQEKLQRSAVLVVGAGGLGSPLLTYLAAAGVGRIVILDPDHVARDNLTRQFLFTEDDLNRPKAQVAAAFLARLNPGIAVEGLVQPAEELVTKPGFLESFHVIADASDQRRTRLLLNDATFHAKKPLVFAAALRFSGQLAVFKPYLKRGPGGDATACYRCLFGSDAEELSGQSCADQGVFGPLTGILGSWQAAAVLAELLDEDLGLSGKLLLFDLKTGAPSLVATKADPDCPLCGVAT